MNKYKILSSFIAGIMLLSFSANVSAEFTQQQEDCPNYLQICDKTFDSSEYEQVMKKLNEIAEDPDRYSDNDVKEYAVKLIEQYSHITTAAKIRDIEFNLDVKDENSEKLLNEAEQLYYSATADIGDTLAELDNAGFEDVLRDIDGYDLINIFTYADEEEDYSKYDDETEKLLNECDELVNEYLSYTDEDFAVEFDGKMRTASQLFDMEYEYDTYEIEDVAAKINRKRNKTLGSIYLELVKKNNQIAKNNGYDNYTDYAYNELYMRDYSPEEIEEIYDTVKNKLSGIYNDLYYDLSYELSDSGLFDKTFSKSELLTATSAFLSFSFPERDYAANFNHMQTHNLCNIDSKENKMAGSYVTALNDYSVPFLFLSPAGDFSDILTMVHEFGHANAEYENPSSAVLDMYGTSLDVCEIHSQGLEVLFATGNTPYITDEEKQAYTKYILYSLVSSIIDGCLFDEFQQYVYEHPDSSLEELNLEYKKICKEYGKDYSEENYYEYDWVEIPHNYDSPLYYISYATSAVSALDIWLDAMNNYDDAVEKYKKIVNCGSYTPYKTAAEECDFATIFDETFISDIAHQIEYYYANEELDGDYISDSNSKPDPTNPVELPENYEFDDLPIDTYDNSDEDNLGLQFSLKKLSASERALFFCIAIFAMMLGAAVIALILFLIIYSIDKAVRKRKAKKAEKQKNDNEFMQ